MHRRSILASLAALPLGLALSRAGLSAEPDPALAPAWAAWKGAHLDASGRVIDRYQDIASHSEGQGYGLCLAAATGDLAAFESILAWTEDNLALRDDALLAWRWLPGTDRPVPDLNNASDGDLFYAWALLRGADTFGRPEWRDRAGATVADLAQRCIVDWPGRGDGRLFLPGAYGFALDDGYLVNPSYYMPLAMRELATAFDAPGLARAASDGIALMGALGRNGPVPDWVKITRAGIGAPERHSPDSGYEALRVPLWLIWSGLPDHPAVGRAYAPGSARDLPDGRTATVVEAGSGTVLEASDAAGYAAIAALVACAVDGTAGSAMPPFAADQAYYPASLHLFAYLAQMETLPRCFPL